MPSPISGKARVILCDLPLGDNQYIETWWVQAGHLKGNSGITNGGLAVLTSPGSQSQNMKPRGDEKVRARVCLGSVEVSGTNRLGTLAFT